MESWYKSAQHDCLINGFLNRNKVTYEKNYLLEIWSTFFQNSIERAVVHADTREPVLGLYSHGVDIHWLL